MKNKGKICRIENCNKKAYCRELCKMHYTRLQRNGDPLVLKSQLPKRQCSVEGCSNIHFGLGFCGNHYYHFKKYGNPVIYADKDKTRKKQSEAKLKNPTRYWLGKKRPPFKNYSFKKGNIPWNKGLKGFLALDKNPQWLGGLSFEPYSPEFNNELKEKIRKRDSNICQECSYTEEQLGYTLSIHHIDYDKKNNDEANLISLCKSCHQKTNFNREDWINYYHDKIGDT